MLRRLWGSCCCCCGPMPGSAEAGTYASLANARAGPGTGIGSEDMMQTPEDAQPFKQQQPHSHKQHPPQRRPPEHEAMGASAGGAFEIEIDDEEEEEDEAEHLAHSQKGGEPKHQHGGNIELQTTQTGGKSPHHSAVRTPIPALSPPPAAAALSAATAAHSSPVPPVTQDGTVTSSDLEAGETDYDIQRFHTALQQAEQHASPTAAAAAPASVPVRPSLSPVQLPRRKGHLTAPPAVSPPLSAGAVLVGVGSASARPANATREDEPALMSLPASSRLPAPIALPSFNLPRVSGKHRHAASSSMHLPPEPLVSSPAIGGYQLDLLRLPAAAAAARDDALPADDSAANPVEAAPSEPSTAVAASAAAAMSPTAATATALSHAPVPALVRSPSAPTVLVKSPPVHASTSAPPLPSAEVPAAAAAAVMPVAEVESVPAVPTHVAQPNIAVTNGTGTAAATASLHSPTTKPAAVSNPVATPSSPPPPAPKPAAPARTVPAATVATAPAPASSGGNPLDRLGIPAGVVTSAHMDGLMRRLKSSSTGVGQEEDVPSYADLFAFLAGASRTLQGEVLRPFILPELQAIIAAGAAAGGGGGGKKSKKAPTTTASSLPPAQASALSPEVCKLLVNFTQWITSLKIDAPARTLAVRFDFGSAGSGGGDYVYIDLPSQPTWVLASSHPTDRFLLHPSNTPKIYRNTSHRLCLKRELLFHFDPAGRGGLASVRAGDVSIKKFVSFNAEMRTEYRPGMVEYDDSKNAFIHMDAATGGTKPLIVDGRYQPRTFDYWLVISVLKQENWVGLPVIGKAAPPNLQMKPHKGYAYP